MAWSTKRHAAESFGAVLAEVSATHVTQNPDGADALQILSNLSLPLGGDPPAGLYADAYWDEEPTWTESESADTRQRDPEPKRSRIASERDLREAIALELGLADATNVDALDQARRAFMWRNHPDRFTGRARLEATRRASIANSLVDEARRRFAGPPRRGP